MSAVYLHNIDIFFQTIPESLTNFYAKNWVESVIDIETHGIKNFFGTVTFTINWSKMPQSKTSKLSFRLSRNAKLKIWTFSWETLRFMWLAKKDNLTLLNWWSTINPRLLVSIWMRKMSMEWLLLTWLSILDGWKLFNYCGMNVRENVKILMFLTKWFWLVRKDDFVIDLKT